MVLLLKIKITYVSNIFYNISFVDNLMINEILISLIITNVYLQQNLSSQFILNHRNHISNQPNMKLQEYSGRRFLLINRALKVYFFNHVSFKLCLLKKTKSESQ